jgi:putative transcriptional regulator
MTFSTSLTNQLLIAMPALQDPNFSRTVTYICEHITPEISVTTSKDVLEAIAGGRGPKRTLIALGYAGWAGGQLEDEMSANAWLSGPANSDIIFRLPPGARWQAAAQLLGIDLNLLSGDAGHA